LDGNNSCCLVGGNPQIKNTKIFWIDSDEFQLKNSFYDSDCSEKLYFYHNEKIKIVIETSTVFQSVNMRNVHRIRYRFHSNTSFIWFRIFELNDNRRSRHLSSNAFLSVQMIFLQSFIFYCKLVSSQIKKLKCVFSLNCSFFWNWNINVEEKTRNSLTKTWVKKK
jgi:hypothetical protein